jgi:ribosomal protein S18 acetylase RimI-like enzyme
MKIQIADEIPQAYAGRIAQLLGQCFSAAGWSEQRLLEHEDRFCSQADAWRHLLALNDAERLVGFATVYTRQIERSGVSLKLGGLGDVCTDPEWRRRGIATAISAAATAELEQADCDIAYLCAAVDDPGIVRLYGQSGFVPLGRPHTYFGRSGRLYQDDDAMVAPICNRGLFEDVLEDTTPLHIGTGNW